MGQIPGSRRGVYRFVVSKAVSCAVLFFFETKFHVMKHVGKSEQNANTWAFSSKSKTE